MNMKHRTLINRITAVIFGLIMISAGIVGVLGGCCRCKQEGYGYYVEFLHDQKG